MKALYVFALGLLAGCSSAFDGGVDTADAADLLDAPAELADAAALDALADDAAPEAHDAGHEEGPAACLAPGAYCPPGSSACCIGSCAPFTPTLWRCP